MAADMAAATPELPPVRRPSGHASVHLFPRFSAGKSPTAGSRVLTRP